MNIRNLVIIQFYLFSINSHATTVDAQGGPFNIPDGIPAGVDIMFDFTGVDEQVSALTLTLELQHGWIGDLSAILTSPRGESQMVIFSRIGTGRGSEFGDSSDFSGIYEFTDRGNDLWQAAANAGSSNPKPSEVYRTSTAGQPLLSNYGGHRTSLAGAFGDLITNSSGVLSDGIWVLNIADHVSGVGGALNAASLTIDTSDVIFKNGFDNILVKETNLKKGMAAPIPRNRMDFTGNGLADFAVVGFADPLPWRILDNLGSGTTGIETNFDLGDDSSGSCIISGDFDGDGIADAAIWNDSMEQFRVRRSSRPNSPPLILPVGQTGDEIRALVGDYDGDGIDDPVTFTNGNITGDPLTLRYLRSSDGVSVAVSMGVDNGTEALVLGGEDFNGNGGADILLGTSGNYEIRDGQTGAVVDTFSFGTGSPARIMIGNFAGDERADITRVFVSASDVVWETRETGTGTILPQVIFGSIGISGTSEFAADADYDGDGYKDYAVWRRNNSTDNSAEFIIRPSSDTDSTINVIFGSMGENPVAIGQSTN